MSLVQQVKHIFRYIVTKTSEKMDASKPQKYSNNSKFFHRKF